jgi:hypothetical protein
MIQLLFSAWDYVKRKGCRVPFTAKPFRSVWQLTQELLRLTSANRSA